MPTVATEGQFRFVVNTRENIFEPPHVHDWVGNEDVCRIDLNSERFMDEPPPGDYRRIPRRMPKTCGRNQKDLGRDPQEVGERHARSAGEECGPYDDCRSP